MRGIIEILHARKGHDEFKIPDDPAKAKEEVDGLLRKGYSLMVESEGKTYKVSRYDEEKNEYIVNDATELRFPAATTKTTAIAPPAGG